MLIRWIARPDACAECKQIAAGSPYEKLPTWPGLGDTACDCRCSVEGTRAGNVMAMSGSAPYVAESIAAADTGESDALTLSSAAALPVVRPTSTVFSWPQRVPSLPSLTSFRVKPLERRWAFALGALIFVAAFVALFSTH